MSREIFSRSLKENLEKKVNTAFFSPVQTFVVAEEEKIPAAEKLNELNEKYPKRNLKIIGVEDFNDLLNRRNIVEIKKQKAVVRSAKFAAKHWAASLLLAVALLLVYVGRFYDFDANPSYGVLKERVLNIFNKNGKLLWNKKMTYNEKSGIHPGNFIKTSFRICDIEMDGENEVILTLEDLPPEERDKKLGVSCYSSKGELIWRNKFSEEVQTQDEIHTVRFNSGLIDSYQMNGKTYMLAYSNNDPNYPSVIFSLNLENGQISKNKFWHSGHLHGGKIGDFNNDGRIELVAVGINNGFERCVIFSIDVNKLDGQAPAPKGYKFLNIPLTNFNNYVLLPKSDYNTASDLRFNRFEPGALGYMQETNEFLLHTIEGESIYGFEIGYRISGKLDSVNIDIGDRAQVIRDSLVTSGKLNLPFTNTREYRKVLLDQLCYWDGEKFITKEEYEK